MKPQVFAFFSGAGFLDLGFELSGYSIVFANEYHEPFLRGYKHSRNVLGIPQPKFGWSNDSITRFVEDKTEHKRLAKMVATAKATGELVGFIGGPPCPDFSVGGKNRGRHGENGKLSATYVDLICEQKPDFFLFENVKGLWRTKRHRAFFEELKRKLHAAGYRTSEKLINCLNFGVPQDRERIILVGFRDDSDNLCDEMELEPEDFPWTRYEKYSHEYLADVPWPSTKKFREGRASPLPPGIPEELTVEHWFRRNDVKSHPNSRHQFQPRAGLARFKSVPEGDDSKKSFKRLHRWRYSPTACYGNNEVHLHPYEARRITVAEALAVQSLPKSFELPSDMSLSDMFKTVGNGVPFLAAKALAKSILDFIKEHHASDGFKFADRDSAATEKSRVQLYQPC